MEALLVLFGIAAAIGLIVMSLYNRLVALRQNRENAFSDIDVQLKQRLDLIPSLVETVKGYAAHEKGVFEEVTNARAGVQGADSTNERIAAERRLGGAMVNVLAVAENYPDLKADQNFQRLMAELSDIENKIAAARRFFNNATNELNTTVQQFPSNIVAGWFGFKTETFFDVDDAERQVMEKAPEIKFGS